LSGILSAIYYSILGVGLSSHFGVGLLLSGVLFLLGGGLIRGADIARVATVAIFGVILFIDGALLLRGASVAVHNSIKSNAPSSIQGFLTPFGVGTKLYIMASLPVVFLTIGIVYLCRPSVKRWFS
jgi:hypothetical protein